MTMNKIHLRFCLTFFLCACAYAQVPSPQPPPADDRDAAGLLGKDYFSASLFTESFRNSTLTHGYGTDLDLNLPVVDNFDMALSGEFERVPKTPQVTDGAFDLSFIGYLRAGGVKPFLDLDVGYLLKKTKPNGTETRVNSGTYAVGAGLEVPVAKSTSLVGRAAIDDEFNRGSHHAWGYTAGVEQIISRGVDALLDVTFNAGNSTVFSLGVAFTF